jgi:transcription antitermination factor NusG
LPNESAINGDGTVPILPLEPFVCPNGLLSQPYPEASGPFRWWVLHTRPRVEKTLARRLHTQSLAFFLPLYKRQWRSRGRLLQSHVPLFPGYVFLHGDSHTRLGALETNLVVRVLAVEDQPQLQSDLVRVYLLMVSGVPLAAEDQLYPGTRVEIVSGPFAGLEGKVLRRGSQLKVFVEIHFLQRGVSAEMESWMLRPLANQENRGCVGSRD